MKITELPNDAVLIKNSLTDYIDMNGNIYGSKIKNNKEYFFIKEQSLSHGYKYCGIKYYKNGKNINISKRVHRLVAEAFIPNPNNFPIVMHIDNNKKNNNVENLKWGTISENTQQAVNDGLLVNDKSWDDSQSCPCDCRDTLTNRLIKSYGSRIEASKDTGITVNTITNQIKNMDNKYLKKKIYFTDYKKGPIDHYIIIQYDYDTDKEVNRFVNCTIASKNTDIPLNTILYQVNNGKPKHKFEKTYFKKVLLKCEETIENN